MEQEPSALGPETWMEEVRVDIGRSFLRLMHGFRICHAADMLRAKQACVVAEGPWRDISSTIQGSVDLSPHALELFKDLQGRRRLVIAELKVPGRNDAGLLPRKLTCRFRKLDEPVEVRICTVEAWLFDAGLGYFVFELQPERASAADWFDALHHLRFTGGRSERQEVRDQRGSETSMADLVRCLLGTLGLGAGDATEPIDLGDTLRAFSALFVSTGRRGDPYIHRRVLSQVVELAHAKRMLEVPSAEEGRLIRGSEYQYSEHVHFVASRDGCSFVALDRDPETEFWRTTMRGHLRRAYFAHYLLTQYQRHSIEELRRAVAQVDEAFDTSDKHWRSLRAQGAKIRSHGYFAELAISNNHVRFERFVREIAQVDRLFETTTAAADELVALRLEDHERDKAARLQRNQLLWAQMGGAFALPTLTLAFLGVNIPHCTADAGGVELSSLLLLTFAAMTVGWIGGQFLRPRRPDIE